jgi:hypothetical protein
MTNHLSSLITSLKIAVPGVTFGEPTQRKGTIGYRDDAREEVLREAVDVFVNGNKVGSAGWVNQAKAMFSVGREIKFFVSGRRIPLKRRSRLGNQTTRESVNLNSLMKFAKAGFRDDTKEEVYERLVYNDEELREANAKIGHADSNLRSLRRLSEGTFDSLMNVVAANGTDDQDLRKLLHEYEDAMADTKVFGAAAQFRRETLRKEAGVSNDKS